MLGSTIETGRESSGASPYTWHKGRNLVSMGRHNRVTVLQCIRVAGEIATADIAQAIGITIPCVFHIVKGLLREGVLETKKSRPLGSGKLITVYTINVKSAYALGLNILPGKVEFVATSLDGRALFRTGAPMRSATIDAVTRFADHASKQCYDTYLIDRQRVRGLGVTFPGPPARSIFSSNDIETL